MYTQQTFPCQSLSYTHPNEILIPPALPPEPAALMKAPTHIGQYLYTLRGKQSIRQAARSFMFSPTTWTRLESGQRPSLRTLIQLHHTLRIPYDILLSIIERDLAEGLYEKEKSLSSPSL